MNSKLLLGGEVMINVGGDDLSKIKYPANMKLSEISKDFISNYKTYIVAAKVDYVLKDLQDVAGEYKKIDFVELASPEGIKIYQRSVVFLLITAVGELYPKAKITVEHSLSNGLYCEIYKDNGINETDVRLIEQRMREIITENRPIIKKVLPKEGVVEFFKHTGHSEKAVLLEALPRPNLSIYNCGGVYDYLHGPMYSATRELGLFALDYSAPGVILRTPEAGKPDVVPPFVEQPKLASIFAEAEDWAHILECNYVANLNMQRKTGKIAEVIRVSEALHEKKVAEIADFIARHIQKVRLILIAGPSSSGKTTFAQRLRIQLIVNGIKPISISLDNYFKDRLLTPRDENGNYDFEALEALDIDLFNDHLLKLMQGEIVELPYYNFITGKREMRGKLIKIADHQPIIIEGIHGLNEKLTKHIPRSVKYKIYISALTQLAIDGHNRIPTTDTRLIRRIVRDYNSRGSNALQTIRQWPSVRAGEVKNIFPYQEDADSMFNSALIYELGILKKYAEPLLRGVSHDVPEYDEALRLLNFLAYFMEINAEDEVPINSILREFIGQSCFEK